MHLLIVLNSSKTFIKLKYYHCVVAQAKKGSYLSASGIPRARFYSNTKIA